MAPSDGGIAAQFGVNLRRARKDAGLSQEEAGIRASLHRTEVGLLERGERIPRFEDAARLARELGLWVNVEIKPAHGFERRTGAAVARMAADLWRGADLQPLLSSFSPVALAAARDAEPQLPRGLLLTRLPPHWLEMLRDLDCAALHCNYRVLKARVIDDAHAAGCAVLAWTVNDRRPARRLLGLGVDCLVTDRLDRIGPEFR